MHHSYTNHFLFFFLAGPVVPLETVIAILFDIRGRTESDTLLRISLFFRNWFPSSLIKSLFLVSWQATWVDRSSTSWYVICSIGIDICAISSPSLFLVEHFFLIAFFLLNKGSSASDSEDWTYSLNWKVGCPTEDWLLLTVEHCEVCVGGGATSREVLVSLSTGVTFWAASPKTVLVKLYPAQGTCGTKSPPTACCSRLVVGRVLAAPIYIT